MDGREKAHVEHTVRLVEHQNLDGAEVDELPLEVVAEAAGRGDDHLRAFADGLQLSALAHSADDNSGSDARAVGHLGQSFAGLDGKLASRTQDHGADAGRLRGQRLEQGEDKSKRLAGAGLRRGDHIVAGKRGRNGLRLYRGRLHKAVLRQVILQDRRQ